MPDQLTGRQIVRLAAAISAYNMASIAEGYLGISGEIIKKLQSENRDHAEAFNREIVRDWTRRKPQDQVKVIVLAIINSE